ncbi:MAG: AI-2E family transporter [Leptolyngbyaceae cyanobacterium SM1_4_3]|nr:AI-2E family transporter [Leptolyngbyaceae cyanobacterium SM1_4_3]NJN89568.1 AI-2E family transporter [Leptolyngbyaceae cyanobacterium SL_5_14]NJO66483.1 AI-2E family transporter [Leptolyngbyaceae cyanobacterium RM1_405_57]
MDRLFTPLQRLLITWALILTTGWMTLNALRYLSELISILVTAGLIAFLLNYLVARLHTFMPRGLAAGVVYLFAGALVGLVGVTIAPPVLTQAQQLITDLPNLIESGQQQLVELQTWSQNQIQFAIPLLQEQILTELQGQAETIASSGVGLLLGTFNWVLDLILILVISFYMLLDGERLWNGVTSFFAPPIQDYLTDSFRRNLQRFFSGQLLLGLFMAVTLSLAFWWLRVPFFLVFATFIGLMEVIPFIGATLGIVIVGLVVAFINWWLAVQVVGVAIALQQIKDNLLAPRILGNLTGLSPTIVLPALFLGGKVGGLLGVILAIPLAGMVKTIAELLLDPTLPPQTGAFFVNPLDPDEPDTKLECIIDPEACQEESKEAINSEVAPIT